MIALIIYLIGIPVSYLFGRHCCKKAFNEYTLKDRLANLFGSLFSWVDCLAILITFNGYIFDMEKEVKW